MFPPQTSPKKLGPRRPTPMTQDKLDGHLMAERFKRAFNLKKAQFTPEGAVVWKDPTRGRLS